MTKKQNIYNLWVDCKNIHDDMEKLHKNLSNIDFYEKYIVWITKAICDFNNITYELKQTYKNLD